MQLSRFRTQHISNHPASLHTKPIEGSENQQRHVVWSHGHQDPGDPVKKAGHQEAHFPAKSDNKDENNSETTAVITIRIMFKVPTHLSAR